MTESCQLSNYCCFPFEKVVKSIFIKINATKCVVNGKNICYLFVTIASYYIMKYIMIECLYMVKKIITIYISIKCIIFPQHKTGTYFKTI